MNDREKFKQNYTGIYNPDKYYDYLKEKKKNEKLYENATYSDSYNKQLLREANNKSFNKHLRD